MGNGFYPLYLEFTGRLRVNCCDFSPRAIQFVKDRPDFNPEHINAQVCDLVNDLIPFEEGQADFGILLFVLSAISPENFSKVAEKLMRQMKPGGVIYFRDYGKYDLA